MGACIVYWAVPPHIANRAAATSGFPRQGFGRRVPLALGPLYVAEEDRSGLRAAVKHLQYWVYTALLRRDAAGQLPVMEHPWNEALQSGRVWNPASLARAVIWGGPPATVADSLARLSGDLVKMIAAELDGRNEAWLRAEYRREQAYLGEALDEDAVIECDALLRAFFHAAVVSASEVVIGWELG